MPSVLVRSAHIEMPAKERQESAAALLNFSLYTRVSNPSKSSYEDRKTNIEFGSCFAQEISGLLPERRELAVASLRRIIHMGFMYEFKEDSVDYLLVKENLELFVEDIEFLGAAFMGTKQSVKRTVKSEHVAPSTPLPPCKLLCRSVL
ncbi:hypothetical protein PanWU01x14_115930 [Parasponia andersonii]|uniref:Uncharacterized protein n=1 Tax=Parasponia andersonii TaxID=3476 RepID=A0A2P5CX39_PARAD|nr:hypothetical protein PanWU01x14_115930 [Parasponia andersonii]